ncbi:ATP-binding protein [Kitasatospora sp. NPDC088346]|uniref:ATP-binding protein n=1 Tax=Kitasatospora sp. NPDC088346 TaxID=3364073 RepID=UPI003812FDB7
MARPGSARPAGEPCPPAYRFRRAFPLADAAEPVRAGRDATRQALTDLRWLPVGPNDPSGRHTRDDVLLMTAEILANACRHAGGPTGLRILATDAVLRVEVSDPHPSAPALVPPPRPGRPGGYGLRVVHLLSDRWGTTRSLHGKAVWFEIGTERPLRQP